MNKRIFAAILAIIISLALLPCIALATAADSVYVGSVELSNGEYTTNGIIKTTAAPTDNYAYFSTAGGVATLTLKNFTLSTANDGISVDGDMTIQLDGVSSVTATDNGKCGICINNDGSSLIVTGNGSLTATATGSGSTGVILYGDYTNMTVQAGSKLTAISPFYGIYFFNFYTTESRLTVDGGEVESTTTGNHGIQAGYIEVKNGGRLTGTSSGAGAIGVYAPNSITVSDSSELTGISTNDVMGFGVGADSSITVNGNGKLTGTATGAKGRGVFSKGQIILNGGTFTASSPSQAVSPSPDLSGYPNCVVTASNSTSGTPTIPYDPVNIGSYKYIHVGPEPLSVTITPDAAFPAGASGGDRTVTVGHGTGLDTSNIGNVSLGGETLVLGTDYTMENSASVDITLKASKLNSLPIGTHRLNIEVTSGAFAPQTPHINIVVSAQAVASAPKTGDSAMPGLWLLMCLLCGAGLLAAIRRLRRA